MKRRLRQWWLNFRRQKAKKKSKSEYEMVWVNGLTAEENMRLNKILKSLYLEEVKYQSSLERKALEKDAHLIQ